MKTDERSMKSLYIVWGFLMIFSGGILEECDYEMFSWRVKKSRDGNVSS